MFKEIVPSEYTEIILVLHININYVMFALIFIDVTVLHLSVQAACVSVCMFHMSV